MSEIKWQVVDGPETDHPFDENNAVLDEDGTPTWCLDCGRTWVGHERNAAKVLDWMARVWP